VHSGSVVISWVGSDGAPHTQVVTAGWQYDVRTGEMTRVTDLTIRDWPLFRPIYSQLLPDNSIKSISRTRGQNDQGQNNNNQGQNQQ
jgi:hypothetical protein